MNVPRVGKLQRKILSSVFADITGILVYFRGQSFSSPDTRPGGVFFFSGTNGENVRTP